MLRGLFVDAAGVLTLSGPMTARRRWEREHDKPAGFLDETLRKAVGPGWQGGRSEPADAAKALWMSCRRERGDFALDPAAVRAFLRHTRFPAADAVDLGRLGALWFLPWSRHVTLLARRDATFPEWYLGWVSRFWARLRSNLDLIAETAALTL